MAYRGLVSGYKPSKKATVILSNFRKTRTKDRIELYRIESYRIESYRIVYSLKIPKKKQRIKLSNIFQIKIKNKNFGIKIDLFKKILQSTILKNLYPGLFQVK
jgi:hypothetical protein